MSRNHIWNNAFIREGFDFTKLKKKDDDNTDDLEKEIEDVEGEIEDKKDVLTKAKKDDGNSDEQNIEPQSKSIEKPQKKAADSENKTSADDESKSDDTDIDKTPQKAASLGKEPAQNDTQDDADQNLNDANQNDKFDFSNEDASGENDQVDDQDQNQGDNQEDLGHMQPNDGPTENDQSHPNFKVLPSKLYHKIFSQPNRLVNIQIPHEINDGQLSLALDGEAGPEGHLILYKVGENKNIPIRILGHVLTTYENFANEARQFITQELMSKVPSEENFEDNGEGTVGMEQANNKIKINPTEKDLKEDNEELKNNLQTLQKRLAQGVDYQGKKLSPQKKAELQSHIDRVKKQLSESFSRKDDEYKFEHLTNNVLNTSFSNKDLLKTFVETYIRNVGKMDFRIIHLGEQLDPVEDLDMVLEAISTSNIKNETHKLFASDVGSKGHIKYEKNG